jgi:hypothetical protein
MFLRVDLRRDPRRGRCPRDDKQDGDAVALPAAKALALQQFEQCERKIEEPKIRPRAAPLENYYRDTFGRDLISERIRSASAGIAGL